MKNRNNSIGLNIKAARLARGLTQKQVADHLNLPYQNISAWERSEASPALKHLAKLSELLGVTVDQLTRGRLAPGDSITGLRSKTHEEQLSRIIREEVTRQLAADPRLKLMETYLEEILALLRKLKSG
ncbi:MAG: helix-turn-helix transcriptional regulator [Candidatus Glassbacteria bacterium]|nr:helix-turn-helix transcriptional regulator [Candidatus Glassbacteria bacterium]